MRFRGHGLSRLGMAVIARLLLKPRLMDFFPEHLSAQTAKSHLVASTSGTSACVFAVAATVELEAVGLSWQATSRS